MDRSFQRQDEGLAPEGLSASSASLQRVVVACQAADLAQALNDAALELVMHLREGEPEQWIEFAMERKADLLLVDIDLLPADPTGFIDRVLREQAMPLVFSASLSGRRPVEKWAHHEAVYGWVTRPVDPVMLRAKLQVAWGRYQLVQSQRLLIEQLKHQLADRKLIERAKGIVMKQQGMDEEQAMRYLQREARNARIRMVDLARSVIERHQSPAT